jgi:hypothetical protein
VFPLNQRECLSQYNRLETAHSPIQVETALPKEIKCSDLFGEEGRVAEIIAEDMAANTNMGGTASGGHQTNDWIDLNPGMIRHQKRCIAKLLCSESFVGPFSGSFGMLNNDIKPKRTSTYGEIIH